MLHFLSEPDKIDFRASAGGAGDEVRPRLPQSGGREDILGRTHLLHRVGSETHPNGVTNALTQQAADADGGFQHSHPGRTRLRDP